MKTEMGSLLGWDQNKTFMKFSGCGEAAACSVIRLAAEVFGPREDEQCGCREERLSFCETIGVTSRFTSFHGNRFITTGLKMLLR